MRQGDVISTKNDQEGVTPQDPRCTKNVTKMNFSHSCDSSEGKVFRVLVPIHNTFMVVMVVVVVVVLVVVVVVVVVMVVVGAVMLLV